MADTSRHDAPDAGSSFRRRRLAPAGNLRGFPGVVLATVFAFAVIAALYVAQDVLILFALSALLSFVLAPPVRGLRRLGFGQGAAVAVVMLGALVAGAGLGALISRQAGMLLEDLPKYEGNVREKIRAVKSWQSGEGLLDKVRDTVSDLGRELTQTQGTVEPQAPPLTSTPPQRERPPEAAAPSSEPGAGAQPMTIETLIGLAEPALKPLADVGLVVLFTIFILLQREDLRNRFIRLAGAGDLNRATVALADAARRLSRFFILQAALNGSFGVFVAVALWGLDVPAALGFGVFAALMRFVPYIGSVLAALPPIAVAAAMEPGWSTALMVAAVFGIGEPLMGQVIEPLVYGRHTGLSPIAVVGAATFWTWLWGPIGLILSTPLTLCLVVLGQHTRALKFLTVLLSDEPALTPAEAFYQRLLAGDAAELVWITETALKSRSLVSYYDDVVLPGLRLAHLDERSGQLDDDRLQDVASALDDLVETLGEAELGAGKDVTPTLSVEAEAGEASHEAWTDVFAALPPEGLDPIWRKDGAIVVYPGRGMLDFASARMAADLLGKIGFGVEVRTREQAVARGSHEAAARVEILASAGGLTLKELRFTQRRIERARPGVGVIACAFAADPDDDLSGFRPILSISDLIAALLTRAQAPVPAQDVEHTQVARNSALSDASLRTA